ncbi:MAG TPA: hypothetical protein VHL11_14435, partial [Phototrophicaceae bacterium]|nr:hypothetical protein [Phototrophicaceae bacterium]
SPVQLSPDQQQLAYIEDGPVLIDLTTGESQRVSPIAESLGGNWGGHVFWHPSQPWIIAEEEGMAGCGSTWYTQVTNGTQRYEVTACGSRGGCAHWLPEVVNPDLYPAYEKPAQPIPVMTLHAGDWVTDLTWSGNILQSNLSYYNHQSAAWDVTTGVSASTFTPTPTAVYPETEEAKYGVRLGESEHYIVSLNGALYDKRTGEAIFNYADTNTDTYYQFKLTADEHLMVAGEDARPLKIWSIPDGQMIYEGMDVTAFALSPDGHYIAVGRGWDVEIYEIADLLKFSTP